KAEHKSTKTWCRSKLFVPFVSSIVLLVVSSLSSPTAAGGSSYNPRVYRFFVIHYHELGLKKGNRDYFENRLCANINAVLEECGTERSEEHTSELQSHLNLVCRLL